MEKNKRYLWLVLALLVVAGAAVVYYVHLYGEPAEESAYTGQSAAPATENTPSPAPAPTGIQVDLGTAGMSYGKVVGTFGQSRLQFDSLCHITPATLSLPRQEGETRVMFDNRATSTTSFTVNGVRYSVAGYGFRVIAFRNIAAHYSATINCGSGKNSAKIDIQ